MPLIPRDGQPTADSIDGSVADEWINALGGNDTVNASDGNDLVYGGDDDDRLYGGSGNDRIFGDAGNDQLYGGWGDDRVFGGDGNDFFMNFEGLGNDSVWGGNGNDYAYWSQAADGMFHGGRGLDHFSVFTRWGATAPVSVDISTGSGVLQGDGFAVVLTSVERLTIYGGDGADSVTGGRFRDTIQVYGGANEVDAGAGNDVVVYVADTANTLHGGDGNDLLYAGGTAFQPLDFSVTNGVVEDGRGSVITGFERFTIYGGSGYDQAVTGDGNDGLFGYFGNDTLDGAGGNDRVYGQGGDDRLQGGDGDDTLGGGAGLDEMTGGAGRDIFRFVINDGHADVVTDFASGEDVLRIDRDAYAIDASVTEVVLSVDGPSGTGAQFVFNSSNGELVWDANGSDNGGETVVATLVGAPAVAQADVELF